MNRSAAIPNPDQQPAETAPEPANEARLRALPSVERLLADAGARSLVERFGRQLTVAALRDVLAQIRTERLANPASDTRDAQSTPELVANLLELAKASLHQQSQAHLRSVFNMTGTVLHTNLGPCIATARGSGGDAYRGERTGESRVLVARRQARRSR